MPGIETSCAKENLTESIDRVPHPPTEYVRLISRLKNKQEQLCEELRDVKLAREYLEDNPEESGRVVNILAKFKDIL